MCSDLMTVLELYRAHTALNAAVARMNSARKQNGDRKRRGGRTRIERDGNRMNGIRAKTIILSIERLKLK